VPNTEESALKETRNKAKELINKDLQVKISISHFLWRENNGIIKKKFFPRIRKSFPAAGSQNGLFIIL
jgi:hypothetical protein